MAVVLGAGLCYGLPTLATAPPDVASQCPYTPGPFPLLLPNPVDCGSFYMCSWYGTAQLQHCPAGLHFNPKLYVCDYPNYFCVVSTTTAPIANTTTDEPVSDATTAAPIF